MIKTKDVREHMSLVRQDNFSDEYVIKEVVGSYGKLRLKGKKVLDLGANIGAFSVYAALCEAKEVVAYEPDPINFQVLKENTQAWEPPATPNAIGSYYPLSTNIEGAVTMSKEGHIPFYVSDGPNKGIHSTLAFNGRAEIEVQNHYFPSVLAKHKPQVIKMDVEGEEHNLLLHTLPKYVKEIVVEIHFNKRNFRDSWLSLTAQFRSWHSLREPKETGKNWHTLGHWRR